jgi:hypothetical protein
MALIGNAAGGFVGWKGTVIALCAAVAGLESLIGLSAAVFTTEITASSTLDRRLVTSLYSPPPGTYFLSRVET